jgi:pyruvate/2-oxoglutarate dehydrogenase complex dihydrolipoamide dehydrogenase (E3) component
VKVDDRLRTTNRRTYAVGDIDNRTRLTPRVKKLFEHLLQMRR